MQRVDCGYPAYVRHHFCVVQCLQDVHVASVKHPNCTVQSIGELHEAELQSPMPAIQEVPKMRSEAAWHFANPDLHMHRKCSQVNYKISKIIKISTENLNTVLQM